MIKIATYEIGKRYNLPLLVKDVKNGLTNKGAAYLSMTLADNTGTIEAKMWEVKEEDIELIKVGQILNFCFDTLDYKGQVQARVLKVNICNETINLADFIISSVFSKEERQKQLQDILHLIKNPCLHQLVVGLLTKVGQKYMDYPAAAKIHHAFLGGLSEHSLGMVKLANAICDLYPQLNRDLLVSGCIVHDIGKIAEMSGPIATEYTLEGKLEGHISLANGWLTEVAHELNLESNEETILLHHMILSHHGHLEYGSPVLPCLQEAEILSFIDNIDARLNILRNALKDIAKGNWTSRIFALENRQFYKPKGK